MANGGFIQNIQSRVQNVGKGGLLGQRTNGNGNGSGKIGSRLPQLPAVRAQRDSFRTNRGLSPLGETPFPRVEAARSGGNGTETSISSVGGGAVQATVAAVQQATALGIPGLGGSSSGLSAPAFTTIGFNQLPQAAGSLSAGSLSGGY